MKKIIFLILVIFSFCSINAQISFEDSADAIGLSLSTGTTFLGNGLSFCDFDNDGWDDITLTTDSSQKIRFFKNNLGDFTEVFFNINLENSQSKQVNWVDIDNDGDKDLFVTSNTIGNRLYRNDGDSNFVDITIISGLPTSNLETFGASWGDINNDSYLDLFISNRDQNLVIPNYLFRNNGNNTFTDISQSAGILTTSNYSFCTAFFDYNNDGLQDVYLANDRDNNINILYKNNGDETFANVSENTSTDLAIDAMSTTIGDYNNDGWFDIYVTNTQLGNSFLENQEGINFLDIAAQTGTTFNSVGWGSVFLDADNDMDLDLYVSGNLDGSSSLPSAFYENDGLGEYTIPQNAGFNNDISASYSNAIGDINNDGLPDIIVSNNNNQNVFVWKNTAPNSNNWLKINLEGTASNKDGIGSVIEISIGENKQYRYTLCGEGYLSQNSSTEFFGLGLNSQVDIIKITWLSGIVDYYYNVNSNQTITFTEGSGSLSIKDVNKINNFIYPNPVSKTLNLSISKRINSLKILDLSGKIVFQKKDNYIRNKTNFNVEFLESGIYFLDFIIEKNRYIEKFIKQ